MSLYHQHLPLSQCRSSCRSYRYRLVRATDKFARASTSAISQVIKLFLVLSDCAPAFKFEGFEANDGIYVMQNDIYNGDVYYKRESPTVRYALRGYNNNWHFPETVNKVGSSSGWKWANEECPYGGVFQYANIGPVVDAITTGLSLLYSTKALTKPKLFLTAVHHSRSRARTP